MPPPAFDLGVKDVIRLLARRDGVHRADFLELACDLLGGQRCMAAYWTWDPGPNQLNLHRYHSPGCDDPSPPELRGRRARPRRATAGGCDPDPAAWELSLGSQPEIRAWGLGHGFGAFEYAFPIVATAPRREEGECIGFIQLLTEEAVPEGTLRVMPNLATGLAAGILRSREQRQLQALERVQKDFDLTRPLEDCLRSAARVLQEVNQAEQCLVFRQERNMGMEALTGWPDTLSLGQYVSRPGSLTHLIAKHKLSVRVADFDDPGQRERVFGTDAYDVELARRVDRLLLSGQGLKAWLAAPVIVGDHAIAVIMLLNKRDDLSAQFSQTDQEVLEAVCRYLAGVIPGVETSRAVRRMSEAILTDVLQDVRSRAKLFELLAELIPGIVSAAVVRRTAASEATHVLHLGGESWFDETPLPSPAAVDVVPFAAPASRGAPPPQGDARFLYTPSIPSLEDQTGWLALGLRREYLDSFEKQVLSFFCAELSQVLRSERHVTRSLEDFVQIRHAVRSGLAGVVGHIYVAQGCYEIYQRMGHAPAGLHPARFRKALNLAFLFSKKTQALLEESRFLLGQITRSSLKIGGTSISGLVRVLVACLRPYAAERQVEILYDNRVPEDQDQVEIDRQLVELLVFNLIENAIKYSHRGQKVHVEIALRGRNWVLSVVDFGVYIRPEDQEAIFKPFVRRPTGSAATTRPGTGLGLAVSEAVAEVHNGTIELTSDLIGGTREPFARTQFTVRIPKKATREET